MDEVEALVERGIDAVQTDREEDDSLYVPVK
jgi:hypothetical protein